jgi:hypothetical protein
VLTHLYRYGNLRENISALNGSLIGPVFRKNFTNQFFKECVSAVDYCTILLLMTAHSLISLPVLPIKTYNVRSASIIGLTFGTSLTVLIRHVIVHRFR